MKSVLKSIDKELCDARFPINLLAFIGLIVLPGELLTAAVLSVIVATLYRQIRVEPEAFKSTEWWKHESWQRIGTYGAIVAFVFLARSAADANLITLSYIWEWFVSPAACMCYVVLGMFIVTCGRAIETRQKQRLIANDKTQLKKLQSWTTNTYATFIALYALIMGLIAFIPDGFGSALGNWLVDSARDANLWGMNAFTVDEHQIYDSGIRIVPAGAKSFIVAVQALFTAVLVMGFWGPASRLACILTTYCKRVSGRLKNQGWIEVFLRTLKEPRTVLKLRNKKPFLTNAMQSLGWLVVCWALLFALFGLSSGPIGATISRWMDACIADAHTGMYYGATANPKLRMFCAAIIALYGTVPFALSACIFLPYARRKQFVLNDEGMLLPGMFLNLRAMRLWTDIAHVDLKEGNKKKRGNKENRTLVLAFHSGGTCKIHLSQLAKPDLEKLLSAIDEHASECVITDAVVALRAEIRAEHGGTKGGAELGALNAEAFQSTTFVPHQPGAWLPNGECRVVRLLASRPLSCVYLVRLECGKLAVAKQFFLAEDDDQTRALRRCFEREYELLQKIDHPAISKVLEVFHKDQSTYLLIDHAEGVDLRSTIVENGEQSEETVIEWALQLCDIMQHLHEHDPPIVHRDLTPDNVIIGDDGKLRIIDFGAAHQFLEGITGTIIGKQSYIAPEQLRGQAGPRSDVYSFGCMLHYLLTAKEPVALTACKPSAFADISEDFDKLVQDCTDFDENVRPESFVKIKERLLELKEKNSTIVINLAPLKEKVVAK